MGEEHQELQRLLFVAATARLEKAHEIAVAGQSGGLNAEDYAELARRLGKLAQAVIALGEAIIIVTEDADADGAEAAFDHR